MDKSPSSFSLCTIRTGCTAMVDCVHRERWSDTKRSTFTDRRNIRFGITAAIILAYSRAYATFHQANSTKANHTDSLDGAHLLRQCGNYLVHS